MTYTELTDFIQHRMRMSHIYQPVMLMALLENEGKCSIENIARSILAHDQSQIEYYEEITKQMPGSVLADHGIVQRVKDSYTLNGFDRLTSDQVKTLVELCRAKLSEYIAKRGDRIWQHRKLSSGVISGSLKYSVLTRAKTRCEACGISNEEKALEVDHIVPRNKGGTDDLSNLQALCYSCNSMKQDKDATDFHQIRESYGFREAGCPFCDIQGNGVLVEMNWPLASMIGFLSLTYMSSLYQNDMPQTFSRCIRLRSMPQRP